MFDILFKSYYVVWKPQANKSFAKHSPDSLNRTMQYGNMTQLFTPIMPSMGFKSYYVVWKQEGTSIRLKLGACLNRTMQYGNISTTSVPPSPS